MVSELKKIDLNEFTPRTGCFLKLVIYNRTTVRFANSKTNAFKKLANCNDIVIAKS